MDHLWIIDKISSTTLFYRNYSEVYLDPDLISGLLSAFNNFSEVELNGLGIDSISMGGLQWIYLNDNKFSLLVIAADSSPGDPSVVRSRLEVILKMFIDAFELTPESLRTRMGQISEYETFASTLDVLQEQWNQAEKVMSAAELFDLLGIFQQIFNLISNIVNDHCQPFKSEIMRDMKEYSNKMEKIIDLDENPEFKKIIFDDAFGWNIITLDPTKINKYSLRKSLFLITSHLKLVLVKYMGYTRTLYLLSKEVLPYIFSSWELLEILNIVKPILTILLERPTIAIKNE
ncbi:MAG: hypothetical protein ACTSVI_11820 [Promethearchaeota archaeon]